MTRDVQMYIIWPVDTRWYKYLLMIEVSEASFWEWCSFLGGIWIQNDSEDIDICGIVVMGRDEIFWPFSTWPMSFGLPTLRPMWILYLQTSAIPILTCQVSFALVTTMVLRCPGAPGLPPPAMLRVNPRAAQIRLGKSSSNDYPLVF